MRTSAWQIRVLLVIAATAAAASGSPEINADPAQASPGGPPLSAADRLQPLPDADDELASLFGQLQESLDNHALDEAEITAKQLVEITAERSAGNSLARSHALQNLALVQHRRTDYDSAIENYLAAIAVVTDAGDMLSADLVPPLHGLARAYADSGDAPAAMRTYDRALHVSAVNNGPHSLAQVPLLQSLRQLYDQQGDANATISVLDRMYRLNKRAYGPSSEELLPVLYQQAEFFNSHDMSTREYNVWLEVLSILRENRGTDDLSLIEPHIYLARNMIKGMYRVKYRSGPTAPSAEKYMKRALAIARENPDSDWKVLRRVLLAMGDYYTLIGAYAQGHRYYEETWQVLSDQAQFDQRAVDLEVNVPLSRPPPNPYANFGYNPDAEEIEPSEYLPGLMVAEFTINERGRVQDIEIVEARPPDFQRMEWRVRSSLKNFVYRPRFVGGRAESTDHVRHTVEYLYLPAEYEASRNN